MTDVASTQEEPKSDAEYKARQQALQERHSKRIAELDYENSLLSLENDRLRTERGLPPRDVYPLF